MALTKRSEEEPIHSMPNSPWILATALALALVCILAVLGRCHHLISPLHSPFIILYITRGIAERNICFKIIDELLTTSK